jgi:primary-amine oxidase
MAILERRTHAKLHSTLETMARVSMPTIFVLVATVSVCEYSLILNTDSALTLHHPGTIKYFDAWHNDAKGEPVKLPNVVCCHEQDDGILWKHTNFRTQNAVVARSRILVLQTIITVSNYEYIFAFHFGQDASLHYEVRATGILSTVPSEIEPTETVPYGTRVAPGVLAPYHQHLFSLRIDPAIDGHANSLVIEESKALAVDDPAVHNDYGIGYVTESCYIDREGGHDLDVTKNRAFKIVNENKINPMTRTPVGFKLLPAYSQMLIADPCSYHAKRSEFAQHAVWVTQYEDNDHFPAGKYTTQSNGGDGIASAIERRNASASPPSVRNSDIVLWHTFGSTHNPRIEDWPVMPSEKMTVGLKPVNFFSGNPGLDVAPSTQEANKSVLYTIEKGLVS